jgi:hypothetical protein
MAGYFASKPRATRSATGKSMAAYQTTLPSFRAASTRAGVMAAGSGAAARTGVANTPTPNAAEPLSTARLENLMLRMALFSRSQD